LFVGGNFVANNTSYYLNVWNYETSSWSAVSSDDIPGIVTTITADGGHSVFAAGTSAISGEAFLARWDGSSWSNIGMDRTGDPNAETTRVQQMAVVPLTSGTDAANGVFASRDRALLVSGQLNLQDVGSVSSALFDGANWYPYLLTSTTSGAAGALAGMFYANNNKTWSRNSR
jgi:hypothetical protein